MSDRNTHPLEDDDQSEEQNDTMTEDGQPPARKRQRVRLSCLECRRRKLSCSRELPCDRCIKSGTPDRCQYETRGPGSTSDGPVSMSSSAFHSENRRTTLNGLLDLPHHQRLEDSNSILTNAVRDHDRVRRLELEVSQLKSALAKQGSIEGSTLGGSPVATKDGQRDSPEEAAPVDVPAPTFFFGSGGHDGLEHRFMKAHSFKTRYHGPYNSWSSFRELAGITPFMKETAEEWLKPLNIQRKDRKARKEHRESLALAADPRLEALLPSKEETDSCVRLYLNQFEQVFRTMHIPTFKKEYETFWDPQRTRRAAFTALVLTMVAVANSLGAQQHSKFVGIKSSSFETAERICKACDQWMGVQSIKHRRLIHFQIAVILFIAKKINNIKKKRYWIIAGNMVRDAILIGLSEDPDNMSSEITPYYAEQRRRIWGTMMELDIQASFDQGVPTMLSQIAIEAKAPRNIEDDAFGEDSPELPHSQPDTEHTFSSYLHLSRQSLHLRLELTRLLTGQAEHIDWEQTLKYIDLIMQELDSLPAWDLEREATEDSPNSPLLSYTLLHLQLRQFLIPLLQPFIKLRKQHSKFEAAELLYYNAAREAVLLHNRLFEKGITTLYCLREDTLNAAMNLCNIILLQPRGSTSMIMSNSQEIMKLIEKCLAIKEDRILRSGNHEPWSYSSMCASLGLLETHLGIKTSEAAKAGAAERFISLHYKLLAFQIPSFPHSGSQGATPATPQTTSNTAAPAKPSTTFPLDAATTIQLSHSPFIREGLPLSMPWIMPQTEPGQLLTHNPDFNLDLLGTDLDALWGGDWNLTGFS